MTLMMKEKTFLTQVLQKNKNSGQLRQNINIAVGQTPLIFFNFGQYVLLFEISIGEKKTKVVENTLLFIFFSFFFCLQLACSGAAVVLSTNRRRFPQRKPFFWDVGQTYISTLLAIHITVKLICPWKKKKISGELTTEARGQIHFFLFGMQRENWNFLNDLLTFFCIVSVEVILPPCTLSPTSHTHTHTHSSASDS